ncbi:MAG TPA: DUF393 domain-containing protein [Verrucomicrobiota bacterium]|nr:DUF393 domain-containing protein [Verrucomicrobiota bacterium]
MTISSDAPRPEVPADFPGTQRGWVFYDAVCPVCVSIVDRMGALFRRRGFEFVPLQESWVAPALAVTPAELRREMKLRRHDGIVVGGAAAWRELGKSVWWLWPLVTAAGWPGFRWLADVTYRWVAEHRYCLGEVCHVPKEPKDRPHHTTGFLELP